MDVATCRRLFAPSSRAALATSGLRGPHIVPIVFAIDENRLYTAIDQKPKTTNRLQRLMNIERDPAVAVLADHYADDWASLWWVRADGVASTVTDSEIRGHGLDLLTAKYPVYRHQRPQGTLIAIDVTSWKGWSAAGTAT
jgi:PPOX class probable F420-dependent enzyme